VRQIIYENINTHVCTQSHNKNFFLNRYTAEDEWKKDEGWEGIVDENEHYTDDELKEWEDEYYDYGNHSGSDIIV